MDVGDCADAILHIMSTDNEPLNVYNLGSHDTISVRDIARIVIEECDAVGAEIKYTGGDRGWAGDIPRAMLSVNKMLETGFDVCMNSEEAIRHTAQSVIRDLK